MVSQQGSPVPLTAELYCSCLWTPPGTSYQAHPKLGSVAPPNLLLPGIALSQRAIPLRSFMGNPRATRPSYSLTTILSP